MTSLTDLRAEAEELARQLPDLSLQAAAADVMHPGSAGRKRAGTGEQFWQYRRYAQTDAATRIDWRRSARSDDHFVRETEMETARTVYVWCDADAGFNWRSTDRTPTKADRAKTIMLGVSSLLAKSGERIGVLGGGRAPTLGKNASARMAEDLLSPRDTSLTPPKSSGIVIIASDFYAPLDTWRARLAPLAAKCRHGVLLQVTDPAENAFPYKGRTRFKRPGDALDRIFGRAETVRDDYLSRFAKRQTDIDAMAANMGWASIHHRSDEPAIKGAAALQYALAAFGGKA